MTNRLPFRAKEAVHHGQALLAAVRSREVSARRGRNSHVAKIQFEDCTAAVKIYPNDGRRRLEHEWQVLTALAGTQGHIAPRPLARCANPTTDTAWAVYEWLRGRPLAAHGGPEGMILEYLGTLHSLPAPAAMPSSLLNYTTVIRGQYGINAQLALLERAHAPDLPRLRRAHARLLTLTPPSLGAPLVVCHTDSNPSNFLIADGSCRAVDWDAGGLGHPVFELAELSTHPAIEYADCDNWLSRIEESYGRSLSSGEITLFKYFRRAMTLWWACRLNRQQIESRDRFSSKDAHRLERCTSMSDDPNLD